jgi:hypothetical protein
VQFLLTASNTRRVYPQPDELLTAVSAATRLRGVGAARPATVEVEIKPLNSR